MEDATEEDRRLYEYFFCSPHAQIADLAMAEIDADIEATWRPCDFCDPYWGDRCEGTKLCDGAAGYDEAQIKQRTAYCCTDLVRPLNCPLQDRIIALAQAFVSSRLDCQTI
jgi:hypothetical protein